MPSPQKRIKKFNAGNIKIVVTGIEITDTSFYGTDAWFDFEIRDSQTDILLDEDRAYLEWCLPGYEDDDEEYFEEWLKETHGIDYEKDYDCDFYKLPEQIKEEWHKLEVETLIDCYQDAELSDVITDGIIEKLEKVAVNYRKELFYIIVGDKANIYEVSFDYYGPHVTGYNNSNTVELVWYLDAQEEIFYVDGVYFDVFGFDRYERYEYEEYVRDDSSAFVVNEDYLDGLPSTTPYLGKVVYDYEPID